MSVGISLIIKPPKLGVAKVDIQNVHARSFILWHPVYGIKIAGDKIFFCKLLFFGTWKTTKYYKNISFIKIG